MKKRTLTGAATPEMLDSGDAATLGLGTPSKNGCCKRRFAFGLSLADLQHTTLSQTLPERLPILFQNDADYQPIHNIAIGLSG